MDLDSLQALREKLKIQFAAVQDDFSNLAVRNAQGFDDVLDRGVSGQGIVQLSVEVLYSQQFLVAAEKFEKNGGGRHVSLFSDGNWRQRKMLRTPKAAPITPVISNLEASHHFHQPGREFFQFIRLLVYKITDRADILYSLMNLGYIGTDG